MDTKRNNTLVIDLSVLPVRPSAGTLKQFLDEKLHLDMTCVKNIQLHTIRNCALIEMRSLEAAERIAAVHHLKHSIVAEEKSFNIPVYLDDNAINVRVHDLPPGLPNAVVADAMHYYGKVRSVARELWKKFFPGIPNGVRVVRIELDKHIPSYIRISDHICAIKYRSQVLTCRRCQRKSHPNKKCSDVSTEHKETIPQSSNVHCEADNQTPMDVAIEEQQSVHQNKRSVSSCTAPMKSPPRKRQVMREREHVTPSEDQQTKAATSTAKRNEMDSRNDGIESQPSDSEGSESSGPDPPYDDLDAWSIKLNKRSKRQDKRLAKILANGKC